MPTEPELRWSTIRPGQHVADVFVRLPEHAAPQFVGKYRAIMQKRELWTAIYSGIDDTSATTLGYGRTMREVRRLCEQHSRRTVWPGRR